MFQRSWKHQPDVHSENMFSQCWIIDRIIAELGHLWQPVDLLNDDDSAMSAYQDSLQRLQMFILHP